MPVPLVSPLTTGAVHDIIEILRMNSTEVVMTREEKNRIQELRRDGISCNAIAKSMGIAPSTVITFCRNHDENETFDVCPQCGAKLIHTPKHKKKKFCSVKCRTLWWNSHLDQVNRQAYYKAVCKCCGKEFWSYGNNHRIFCSRRCSDEYRWQGRK